MHIIDVLSRPLHLVHSTLGSVASLLIVCLSVVCGATLLGSPARPLPIQVHDMAPPKNREAQTLAEFRSITGAANTDAQRFIKKHKTLEAALDAFYNDPAAQAAAAGQSSGSGKDREKKLGDIWEKYKDPSNPKLITIEGTMELCQELEIDPESDPTLFCLAHDLGSKTTGEWEKAPFVAGWAAMPGHIDSIASMKARLPAIKKQLYEDPVYFKKVYMHTFDLVKAEGARTLALDNAIELWKVYIIPALQSRPSALAHRASGEPASVNAEPPAFGEEEFELWLDFQKKKGKAVSKDTWSLFIDFIRSIDKEFKNYDEEAAWPSTIDDFVEYVRKAKA